MITDLLIGLVVSLFGGLQSLVPGFTGSEDPVDFATGQQLGSQLGSIVGLFSNYFPILTLGACLALVGVVRLFAAGWQVLVFVYDRFPLKFT